MQEIQAVDLVVEEMFPDVLNSAMVADCGVL